MLSSPRVCAVRDQQVVLVPAREIVVGDILILGEGDRVPADALILAEEGLAVDESALTGESILCGNRKHPSGPKKHGIGV